MNGIDRSNLEYLGVEFQHKLVQQILSDERFGESIMDILDPNYFGDTYLRDIAATIKEAYDKDGVVLDIGSLQIRIFEKLDEEIEKNFYIRQFTNITTANMNDGENIQKMSLKFCKQQELNKAVRKITKIIDRGSIDDYDECEEILKKALEVGVGNEGSIGVCDNIDNVLSADFRAPIPTGIETLDQYMGGGLSKGELGVILAAFGVGKTTFITKIANSAMNAGKNVLQIFFEDNPKVIQRKHFACWTGIGLNEMEERSEEVKELVLPRLEGKGQIRLKKMPSEGTTIPKIKQYIKKEIARGFRPDVILVDYIDCIQPASQTHSEWSGEGNVMRAFETMLSELNIAGWTAVQGNRSSINADIVDSSQIGGSIKKGQIGHFIVSIAKNLQQKEDGTANMAILKSRFGKDGIIMPNIIFNNATVNIEITEQDSGRTFLENNKIKEGDDLNRVNRLLQESLEKKRAELSESAES